MAIEKNYWFGSLIYEKISIYLIMILFEKLKLDDYITFPLVGAIQYL